MYGENGRMSNGARKGQQNSKNHRRQYFSEWSLFRARKEPAPEIEYVRRINQCWCCRIFSCCKRLDDQLDGREHRGETHDQPSEARNDLNDRTD